MLTLHSPHIITTWYVVRCIYRIYITGRSIPSIWEFPIQYTFTSKIVYVLIACLCTLVSGCADGALGMRGSPAWYATATKSDIERYEKNGGTRSSFAPLRSFTPATPSNTSSRISGTGRNIYNSDGSSSRISANGRNIYNSDSSSSRVSANGRNVYNSDGTSCRISSSGRQMYCN